MTTNNNNNKPAIASISDINLASYHDDNNGGTPTFGPLQLLQ